MSINNFISIAKSYIGKGRYIKEGINIIVHNYPLTPDYVIQEFRVLFADWGNQYSSGKYSFLRDISMKSYKNKQIYMNCWQFILLCLLEANLIDIDNIKLLYYYDSLNKDKRIPDFFIDDIRNIDTIKYIKNENEPVLGDIIMFKRIGTNEFWHVAIYICNDKIIEHICNHVSTSFFTSHHKYDDLYIVSPQVLIRNITNLVHIDNFIPNQSLNINDNDVYYALFGFDGIYYNNIKKNDDQQKDIIKQILLKNNIFLDVNCILIG